MYHNQKNIVFLCGARDFHAMDWYRSAQEQLPREKLCIVTDLIAGEGFQKLISEKDNVYFLIILDKFLLKRQSKIGDLWRNILKLLVLPIQIILLKRFDKKNANTIYYAHSMYYLWLAAAANVEFVGTPQGSDILVKPFRSRIFHFFSKKSMKKAKFITVDSVKMKEKTYEIARVNPKIIQNGIDLKSIQLFLTSKIINTSRKGILSIRGLAPLYRVKEALFSRNRMVNKKSQSITFVYPFSEGEYKDKVFQYISSSDIDLGRVTRAKMYELIFNTQLVISIPSSDSSPRSVYEAIFCGAAVAISYHPYYDGLPDCMKERIILIDIENENFIEESLQKAKKIIAKQFIPCEVTLDLFDQRRSFKRILSLINEYDY